MIKLYCKFRNPTSGHCDDTVSRTSSWTGAVGLIYSSDYGFASSNSICYNVDVAYNYDCFENNWLTATSSESNYWSITHRYLNWFVDVVHHAGMTAMGNGITDSIITICLFKTYSKCNKW